MVASVVESRDVDSLLPSLEEVVHELQPSMFHLSSARPAPLSLPPPLSPGISFNTFGYDDIVLFLPPPAGTATAGGGSAGSTVHYTAFNLHTPHHYLSPESRSLIGEDKYFTARYVIGRVVMKEEKTVGVGQATNPYSLPLGTIFFEVHLASIAPMVDKMRL